MKPIGAAKWGITGGLVLLLGIVGCRRDTKPVPASPPTAPSASQRPTDTAEISPRQAAVRTSPPVANSDGEASTAAAPGPATAPLVDHPETLQRLHPDFPVWFDRQERQVVLLGSVCQNHVPLEMFACQRGSKEHESVLSIDTRASVVHAGLLAAGAEPGKPVQYQPEFAAARGPEIDVIVVWQDERGQRLRARGQDWVRETRTGKAMPYPWVFGGSQLLTDPETGQQLYLSDGEGDLICVSNFPSAMLDIPVQSTDANKDLLFEAFTEHIPPVGTVVTVLLKPKPTAPAASPPELPKSQGPGA